MIFRLMSMACIGALAMSATSGFAAEAEGQRQARTGGIEEIIVTARKREETLQDAPLTVTALSKERIDSYDITSLERIAATTPNLYVGRVSNGSGAQITMRGIGATGATSIGIEQSVAVILNGAYYGQGRVLNEGMFDLQQIEVLKGPQSLFFGKNATAGVISLTSAKPTEEFEATARVGYEFEAEQMRYEGIISGPISDTVGGRLAVRYSDMNGGYYKNRAEQRNYVLTEYLPEYGAPAGFLPDPPEGTIINDISPADLRQSPQEEELILRGTLTFDPNDQLSMVLTGQYTDVYHNQSAWNHKLYNCDGGFSQSGNECDDSFSIALARMPASLVATMPASKSNQDVYNDYESYSVNLNLEYSFGNFQLSSVTNYQKNTNKWGLAGDFQNIDTSIFATEDSVWKAFSEELRITSDLDGPMNFMAGIFYQKTERDFKQWVTIPVFGWLNWNPGAPDASLVNVTYNKISDTDGETISPFVQLLWDVAPNVEISAGVRYTDETKDSVFDQPYVHPFADDIGILWSEGVVAADQKFDEWSPEVTVSWQPTDEVNLYAAYKTAYKSGGFSNGSILAQVSVTSDFTFEPETSDGFEIGLKSTLFDNQLRLNVTLYDYEFDDLQLDYFDSFNIAFVTLNAGTASSKGVEVATEYAPLGVPGLTLMGSINYNKAKYEDFIAPCYDGQTAALGCDTTVPGTNSLPGTDISGEPTGMAPKWTASAGFDYRGELGNGWTWGIASDLLFSDDYNASALGHPYAGRDSYVLLNASAYVATVDERWQLQVLAKNLTDEMVISGMLEAAGSRGNRAYADLVGYGNLPRTVALQLTYNLR
ncbi:MAG TPA: TonB-dependent receptor [Gammaproteobacteria bacterium]